MTLLFTEIEKWLGQRHQWLQDAATRLIDNDNILSEKDIEDLIELCKVEAHLKNSDKEFKKIETNSISVKDVSTKLTLKSVHSIKGINALGPRNPLTFNGSLSIVYGQNGSGKSSYVRLLKHISGAKKLGKLLGNVYDQDQHAQECSLNIILDGENKDVNWTPEVGTLSEISPIQIYDTDCGNIYVNEENEVTYEPWILQLFSQLTNTCVKVGQAIKQDMESISLTKLSSPQNLLSSKSIIWLNKISASTSIEEIEVNCSWNDKDELNLINKRMQIAEIDPIEKMHLYKNNALSLKNLYSLLKGIKDILCDEKCEEIINAKLDYTCKKKAEDEDAKKVFENLPFEGVGTESWKLLWDQARLYSEQHAYPNMPFPNTLDDTNCVLCHQPLLTEAKERLNSFELYVKAGLSKQANEAEKHLNTLLQAINEIPSISVLELQLKSIGINSDDEKKLIIEYYNCLQKRRESLNIATSIEQLYSLPSDEILTLLNEVAEANDQQATTYYKLSTIENRDGVKKEILELEGRKWLNQNIEVIYENVDKLKKINKYKTAFSLTNTQALSIKKSSLSDELITNEYIKRFQAELKELGGDNINVTLVKTKAERGHIYHQIRLNNCLPSVRTSEVLSEGELRIVSLAGFIADVEGSSGKTPFIFDDPISSLDQIYEEATIKRIAKLSLTRQVIVFTHRLSLLTLLEDAASELGVDTDVTWLRNESWGSGEPGETPVFAKKPEKALNLLQNERLVRARKVLDEHGSLEYNLLAKGICSDFRILIERFIENDLLADIVQRFRRSINTMGKINKLAHISVDDCIMFEEFMTKYSKYEHSQPYETPIMLPGPDELKEDMEKIRNWLKDFNSRTSVK